MLPALRPAVCDERSHDNLRPQRYLALETLPGLPSGRAGLRVRRVGVRRAMARRRYLATVPDLWTHRGDLALSGRAGAPFVSGETLERASRLLHKGYAVIDCPTGARILGAACGRTSGGRRSNSPADSTACRRTSGSSMGRRAGGASTSIWMRPRSSPSPTWCFHTRTRADQPQHDQDRDACHGLRITAFTRRLGRLRRRWAKYRTSRSG